MLATTSTKESTMYEPTRRHLLRDLTGAGVGAAGATVIGGRLLGHAGIDDADAATPSCTLTPEQEEGPYYLDLEKIRKDITEDKAGLRLDLRFKVVNANTCKAMEDVAVDIWHADPGGVYSGFSAEGTAGETYLRGVQLTDEHGLAVFRTVYPGWYTGRAIHIHLKTYVGGRAAGRKYNGGRIAHTGQVFFNDAVSDKVVALSPYNKHTGTRTRNRVDRVYTQQHGSSALLRLRRRKASTIRKGLIASVTVGIDPS
jgi:protocatechuate 3,4-dioxygenase beta subunit